MNGTIAPVASRTVAPRAHKLPDAYDDQNQRPPLCQQDFHFGIKLVDCLNLGTIIAQQQGGLFSWNWFWLFPLFVVYFISGVAETNRAPFDVAEGESEIVAGFHVEYSGIGFALFFLAEYANMILIAALTAVFFFGGWQSPLNGYLAPDADLFQIPLFGMLLNDGTHWLAFKTFLFLCLFLWLRATFPRYRYDQIMRLGWKALIPVTIVWIFVEMLMIHFKIGPWSA